MLSRARRSTTVLNRDAGVSLLELMVSIGLMAVAGAMAIPFFVTGTKLTSTTSDASIATANVRAVLSSVVGLLQLADTPSANAGYSTDRFQTITPSSVSFYTNANGNRSGSTSRSAPLKVVLTASGVKLTQYLYRPISPNPTDYTTNYPTTPTSTVVLLSNLGGTSVFTYCSALVDTNGNCVPATTGGSVAYVTVTFVVTGFPGEKPQTLTSTVGVTGATS